LKNAFDERAQSGFASTKTEWFRRQKATWNEATGSGALSFRFSIAGKNI